jgi:hypothetical protein
VLRRKASAYYVAVAGMGLKTEENIALQNVISVQNTKGVK